MNMSNDTVVEGYYSLDDRLIGGSYVVMCVGIMVVYIPCVWVIGFDAELKNLSCLRMMFHVGISEITILLGVMIWGVLSLTGYSYIMPYWLSRSSALSFIFGWHSYCFLVNLLSFNRCVYFCLPTWQDRLFSASATRIWLIFCWLCGFFLLGVYLTPYTTWLYIPTRWIGFYDINLSFTATMMKLVNINCTFNLGCVVVCYAIIFIMMKFKLTNMVTVEDPETRKKERGLLFQALIICISGEFTDLYWHYGIETACNNIGIYCYPIGTWAHILNCGVNPLVYLTFNKTITMKVKNLFKKSNHVQPAKEDDIHANSQAFSPGHDIEAQIAADVGGRINEERLESVE